MLPYTDALRKKTLNYVALSLFCAVFAAVYEYFGHGVWSYPMVFAFLIPLTGGALPLLLRAELTPAAAALWRAGLAAWTVGSLFRGTLEIYGTTHAWTIVYPILGAALCIAALAGQLHHRLRRA